MAFALIADEYSRVPPVELAEALHVVLKMPLLDARTAAARSRGIWAQNIEAGQSKVIQRMLAACGKVAHVLEQSEVVIPTPAVRVPRLQLDADGLRLFFNYRDASELFPWPQLAGVSAGLVYVERIERKQELVESDDWRGAAFGNIQLETRTKDESTIEPTCLLALADAAGSLRLIRLRGRGIQYAETLPGTMQAQSTDNFRLLLARLGNLATAAAITPQTYAVAAGQKGSSGSFPDPNFASDDEHEAHFRWFLSRQRITAD